MKNNLKQIIVSFLVVASLTTSVIVSTPVKANTYLDLTKPYSIETNLEPIEPYVLETNLEPTKEQSESVDIKEEDEETNFFNNIKQNITNAAQNFKDTFISNIKLISNKLKTNIFEPIKDIIKKTFTSIFNYPINRLAEYIYFKDFELSNYNNYDLLDSILDDPIISNKNKIKLQTEFIETHYLIELESDNGGKWSDEQLDWFAEIIEDLPSSFLVNYGLSTKPTFIRKKEHDKYPGTCATASLLSYTITIYDQANDCLGERKVSELLKNRKKEIDRTHYLYEESSFKHTLVHELGHALNNNQAKDSSKISTFTLNSSSWSQLQTEFAKISWSKTIENVTITHYQGQSDIVVNKYQKEYWNHDADDKTFISSYADNAYIVSDEYEGLHPGDTLKFTVERQIIENGKIITIEDDVSPGLPWEDWAESIGFYVVFPEQLESLAPLI
jgi:hypothetical protein